MGAYDNNDKNRKMRGVTAGQGKACGRARKRESVQATISQTYRGGYPVDILLDVFIYTQRRRGRSQGSTPLL